MQKNAADQNFTASILFTDKIAFSLEDVMNVYNLHIWAGKTTHATCTHASEGKFILNMWTGIVGDYLLDLYNLTEKFDGCIYLAFLQEFLPDMLNDVPLPFIDVFNFSMMELLHILAQIRTHLQATFPGTGLITVTNHMIIMITRFVPN